MIFGQSTISFGGAPVGDVQLIRKLRSLPNDPHPLVSSGGAVQKGDPEGSPSIASMAQLYCVEVSGANWFPVGYAFFTNPLSPSTSAPFRSQ